MHKFNRKNNKSRSHQSFYLGIIVTVLLVGAAIIESRGLFEINKADSFSFKPIVAKGLNHVSLNDNFLVLDKWSDSLLDKEHIGSQWVLRWDIEDVSESNMEKMAQELYVDEHNKPLNKVINEDGTYITGLIPNHNGKLSINRVFDELGDDIVIAILQVENDPSKSKSLKEFVAHIDKTITKFSERIQINVKITGVMQDDALKRIHEVTKSLTVEEYKDESMKVTTAYSTKLKKSYWLLDNKMVNLQYAVYADKNTKNSILTLAIPLISGEFGEITAN